MRNNADTGAPHSRWPRELVAGELTGNVIGAFYEVFAVLGEGFLERVYCNALEIELKLRAISFVREFPLKVWYKGQDAGSYRGDFLVEDILILEVKAGKRIEENNKAQLLHYLKATRKEVGLVLKFGPKPEFDRVVNSRGRRSAQIS